VELPKKLVGLVEEKAGCEGERLGVSLSGDDENVGIAID
jgi:hypothetical protein